MDVGDLVGPAVVAVPGRHQPQIGFEGQGAGDVAIPYPCDQLAAEAKGAVKLVTKLDSVLR